MGWGTSPMWTREVWGERGVLPPSPHPHKGFPPSQDPNQLHSGHRLHCVQRWVLAVGGTPPGDGCAW